MNPNRFRNVLVFCVFTAAFIAAPASLRAAIEEMLGKSYRERSVIFNSRILPRLQARRPSDRLPLLESWLREARKAGDRGAELELLLARYKVQEELGILGVDAKIAGQTAMLRTLDKRKYPEYAARLMYDIGNTQFGQKRNFALAFEQFVNAYNLSRDLSSRDFPEKKHIIISIGNRYYSLGDLDRSRSILLEADTMEWDSPRVNRYNIRNTLGLICRALGQYDSAVYFFTRARELALADSNHLWASIATGNIGICDYLRGRYADAVPLLENDIRHSLQPGSLAEDNGVNSLLVLGDIHFRQERLDLVAQDLARVRSWLPHCRDQIKPRELLYRLEAKLFARQSDYKRAYHAQDSANYYKDSIAVRDNVFRLARMEHAKDLESQQAKLQRSEAERRLAIYTRNSLLAGLGLLGIIAFLGISRQRLRNRERHRRLVEERERAEEQLRTAGEQISSFTRNLQEKNALIERSAAEIEKLQEEITAKRDREIKNEVLQKLYSSTILTDEEWTRFRILFEQIHPGYLQHLKDTFPELTPADTRFLVLTKLGLNSKEMSGMLGVAPDTIRTYRHRLRRRFEQSNDPQSRSLLAEISL